MKEGGCIVIMCGLKKVLGREMHSYVCVNFQSSLVMFNFMQGLQTCYMLTQPGGQQIMYKQDVHLKAQ